MTAQTKKIRWGVLGWARIARENVIPAIQRSGNSEFHAIASREISRIAQSNHSNTSPSGSNNASAASPHAPDPAVSASGSG